MKTFQALDPLSYMFLLSYIEISICELQLMAHVPKWEHLCTCNDFKNIILNIVLRCQRLGLVSLAYLWRRNQKELLQEMIINGVDAIIIKVIVMIFFYLLLIIKNKFNMPHLYIYKSS